MVQYGMLKLVVVGILSMKFVLSEKNADVCNHVSMEFFYDENISIGLAIQATVQKHLLFRYINSFEIVEKVVVVI